MQSFFNPYIRVFGLYGAESSGGTDDFRAQFDETSVLSAYSENASLSVVEQDKIPVFQILI